MIKIMGVDVFRQLFFEFENEKNGYCIWKCGFARLRLIFYCVSSATLAMAGKREG